MQTDPWTDVGPLYNAFEARREAVRRQLDAAEAIVQTPRYAVYFKDGHTQRGIDDLRRALVEDCDGLDALALFEDTAVKITDQADLGRERVEDWISDIDF